MNNNNFDFLRFYLAFIVVITHTILLSGVAEFQDYLKFLNSYTSVTGFFIISGYLITKSYINSTTLKIYLKKRAARLIPAYLIVILFSAIFLSLINEKSLLEYFSNLQLYKYLFANLTFQNYLQPCLPYVFSNNPGTCAVNGALWTLKIEIAFYLSLPFIIYLIKRFKSKILLLIILYFSSIIYKTSFEFFGNKYNLENLIFLSRQFPGFISYFVCGIGFYYFRDIFLNNKYKWIIAGLLILIIENKINIELFTPIALSTIIFTVSFSLKFLNNFAKYGDISYGIYIYHFPIINIVTYMGLFKIINPYIIAILTTLIILFVSFVSWHLVEKKFLIKIRQK